MIAFQVWDWDGEHYDMGLYMLREDGRGNVIDVRTRRSRLYAVTIDRLQALCTEASFIGVKRLDGPLHQPVIVATKPLA